MLQYLTDDPSLFTPHNTHSPLQDERGNFESWVAEACHKGEGLLHVSWAQPLLPTSVRCYLMGQLEYKLLEARKAKPTRECEGVRVHVRICSCKCVCQQKNAVKTLKQPPAFAETANSFLACAGNEYDRKLQRFRLWYNRRCIWLNLPGLMFRSVGGFLFACVGCSCMCRASVRHLLLGAT